MKTLYLDCGMGAAGDMLTAALLELLPEPKAFLQELNALGIPGVVTTAVRTEKCGICGTQLSVTVNGAEEESEDVPLAHTHACSHVHEHEHEHEHAHEHPHSHTGMADIRARIAALPVPQRVRDNILAVYGRLAAAESEAHGRPVDQIHFHEVGTMDALADITAVCLLLERLPCMLAAATSAAPTAFSPFPPRRLPFCCAAFPFTAGTSQASCARRPALPC